MSKIKYHFAAIVWQHPSPGGWHFVSLPKEFSREVREHLKFEEEGWGRLKALAATGKSEWKTAIWFDTELRTYLLPIKSEIRKKEKIKTEEEIKITISL